MKQPEQISFAARAAHKIAARKRTAGLLSSGAITPHEAQLTAAPYSSTPVTIVNLREALARRYADAG